MKRTKLLFSILLSVLMTAMLIPTLVQAATLTTVTVKKTDANGNPLAGAVFTLTGTDNSINKNYNATSGENGIAEFVDVADGTYDLTEDMAPDGYIRSNEVYHIAVNGGVVYRVIASENATTGPEYLPYETITFVNEAVPTYPVTVKKTDKDGNPLAGAVFTLTGTGNYVGRNYEATSDKNGNAVFNVRDGWYTLAEKTAPEGYTKSDKTYDICVNEGEISFVKQTDNGTDYSDYETVTYVNEKVPAHVTPKSPKTGDSSHMVLWLALSVISGGAAIGTTVYSKKRKTE